jgi:hypothetical protein
MVVFFLPLLGALNWLNIPLAVIGLIVSSLSIIGARRKEIGIAGIVLCSLAIVVGIARLKIGCGIF